MQKALSLKGGAFNKLLANRINRVKLKNIVNFGA